MLDRDEIDPRELYLLLEGSRFALEPRGNHDHAQVREDAFYNVDDSRTLLKRELQLVQRDAEIGALTRGQPPRQKDFLLAFTHEDEEIYLLRSKSILVALGSFAFLIIFAKPAHAEHGDWLLGTDGLLSAQQAPEGILYQNLWSYYHASGNSFLQTGPVKCGPAGKLCLGFNANVQRLPRSIRRSEYLLVGDAV